MAALIETFPDLSLTLVGTLRAMGHADLADQLEAASVRTVSFDESANAGYIGIVAGRPLNSVETNIIGSKLGSTLPVSGKYWSNLDLDNFGRVLGIEVLCPPPELGALLKSARSI